MLALDPALAMRSIGWRPRLAAAAGAAMDRRMVSRGRRAAPAARGRARSDRALRGAAHDASRPACLGCGAPLTRTFVDLGRTPLANSFVPPDRREPDPVYPLHARVCDRCLLVQVEPVVPPAEIFSDYAYFSSYLGQLARALPRLRRDGDRALRAVGREQGGRDRQQRRLSADELRRRRHSVPRRRAGRQRGAGGARQGRADRDRLLRQRDRAQARRRRPSAPICWSPRTCWRMCPTSTISSPALRILLKPAGRVHGRVPAPAQSDPRACSSTPSITSISPICRWSRSSACSARHGLRVFDVEELPTHGGSLRVFVCHDGSAAAERPGVARVRDEGAQRAARPRRRL